MFYDGILQRGDKLKKNTTTFHVFSMSGAAVMGIQREEEGAEHKALGGSNVKICHLSVSRLGRQWNMQYNCVSYRYIFRRAGL